MIKTNTDPRDPNCNKGPAAKKLLKSTLFGSTRITMLNKPNEDSKNKEFLRVFCNETGMIPVLLESMCVCACL